MAAALSPEEEETKFREDPQYRMRFEEMAHAGERERIERVPSQHAASPSRRDVTFSLPDKRENFRQNILTGGR